MPGSASKDWPGSASKDWPNSASKLLGSASKSAPSSASKSRPGSAIKLLLEEEEPPDLEANQRGVPGRSAETCGACFLAARTLESRESGAPVATPVLS